MAASHRLECRGRLAADGGHFERSPIYHALVLQDLLECAALFRRRGPVPGQVFHIPAGRKHRRAALETCNVLEVSPPELEDLVRLHDDFGRA